MLPVPTIGVGYIRRYRRSLFDNCWLRYRDWFAQSYRFWPVPWRDMDECWFHGFETRTRAIWLQLDCMKLTRSSPFCGVFITYHAVRFSRSPFLFCHEINERATAGQGRFRFHVDAVEVQFCLCADLTTPHICNAHSSRVLLRPALQVSVHW